MCQNILNEEEDDLPVSDGEKPPATDPAKEANGNIVEKMSALDIGNQDAEASVNGNDVGDENMNSDVSGKTPSANKKKVKKGNNVVTNNDTQHSADGIKDAEIVAGSE